MQKFAENADYVNPPPRVHHRPYGMGMGWDGVGSTPGGDEGVDGGDGVHAGGEHEGRVLVPAGAVPNNPRREGLVSQKGWSVGRLLCKKIMADSEAWKIMKFDGELGIAGTGVLLNHLAGGRGS